MRYLVIAAVHLGLASSSFAQSAPDEEKSPSTAVLMSLGITTAGYVTLIAADGDTMRTVGLGAIYLGPSTGQWYAGELGGLGLGARALGAASTVYGFSLMLQSENDCEPEIDGDCGASRARSEKVGRLGALMFFSGASLWVGSTIADVVFAERAATRWNQRHALTIAPTALSSGGQRAPGFVVAARF